MEAAVGEIGLEELSWMAARLLRRLRSAPPHPRRLWWLVRWLAREQGLRVQWSCRHCNRFKCRLWPRGL